jgi:two-component system chemotaxis response regulator CheY
MSEENFADKVFQDILNYNPDNEFKKILVVDDITYVVKTITRILEDAKFFCMSAMTGQDALEKYQRFLPDLITIDQRLPDMTGLDLVKKIRSLNVEHTPKIIFISAMNDKDIIRSIIQNGVDEFLLKPFQKQKLLDSVNRLCNLKEIL